MDNKNDSQTLRIEDPNLSGISANSETDISSIYDGTILPITPESKIYNSKSSTPDHPDLKNRRQTPANEFEIYFQSIEEKLQQSNVSSPLSDTTSHKSIIDSLKTLLDKMVNTFTTDNTSDKDNISEPGELFKLLTEKDKNLKPFIQSLYNHLKLFEEDKDLEKLKKSVKNEFEKTPVGKYKDRLTQVYDNIMWIFRMFFRVFDIAISYITRAEKTMNEKGATPFAKTLVGSPQFFAYSASPKQFLDSLKEFHEIFNEKLNELNHEIDQNNNLSLT